MRRPSPALVIATLALFVALGGTSYAVSKLPKNSVGTSQLRPSAVTSSKVKNGSLTADDLAAGTLMSGPRGPRGAEGPQGPAGASGITRAYIARAQANRALPNTEAGSTTVASLRLPAGAYAIDFTSHVFSFAAAPLWVDCDVRVGADSFSGASTTLGAAGSAAQEAVLAASDVVELRAASTVAVTCGLRSVTADVKVARAKLRALPVSAIESQ